MTPEEEERLSHRDEYLTKLAAQLVYIRETLQSVDRSELAYWNDLTEREQQEWICVVADLAQFQEEWDMVRGIDYPPGTVIGICETRWSVNDPIPKPTNRIVK